LARDHDVFGHFDNNDVMLIGSFAVGTLGLGKARRFFYGREKRGERGKASKK